MRTRARRGRSVCASKLHQTSAYVWAQLLYCVAGIMIAGITAQPSAFEGDNYLLISVAVVVLGGTSLLGGRGFPLATIIAAVFLEQLVQFVVELGVSTAIQTIVQAARSGARCLALHRQLGCHLARVHESGAAG